jgi:Na+/H+ antiporter NhaD/arsenite permease-like protein
MITAAVIFGITYLAIAVGRIPTAIIAILGAAIMVFARVLSPEQALVHVDLEVILLLAGMMVLADIISRTGAFDWAAIKGARLVRGSGFGLLALLVVLTAIASALLDNVTTVVIMVPITLSLCRTLDLDPVPFLLGEVFASNIGGTATIVGDPPNIIVASVADIGFLDFAANMAPVSAISMVALMGLLFIWFRRDVRVSEDKRAALMATSSDGMIKDSELLKKSLAVFALTIAAFFTHDIIGVSPAFVAIGGAAILLLISGLEPGEILREVEWTTLSFFAGLFILVGGLAETGVIDKIQDWIIQLSGGDEKNLALLMVFLGGGLSAIIDNIPFTATMSQVVVQIAGEPTDGTINPLWWALTLGADLGGNFTIVGASANVVVITVARAAGYPIGFVKFFKYGFLIGTITLLISSGYILLRYF